MSTPLRWRKSSRRDPYNCVELAWKKSSYSDPYECVELAWGAVRDSKNPNGPMLLFDPAQLQGFIATLKAGPRT
jgi:hypothetical protein